MTRSPASANGPLVALLLAASLVACSRGVVAADDGPPAARVSTIPTAAASARLAPSQAPPVEAPGTGTAPSGNTLLLSPDPSPGVGHAPAHIRDDGATMSSAGLPPEVVRRIVRQNFGRFRFCYESALRTDPTLSGQVRIRFVIEPDGAVGTVSDAGSLIGDPGMVACMQRAFGSLAFPEPSGGAMTVTYSLAFVPS